MMDALVNKAKRLEGEITPPGSKSYTHRILAATSLGGNTLIKNPSHSEANEAMMSACRQLGATITLTNEKDWNVKGFNGHPEVTVPTIYIGNSGTALRISTALASLIKGEVIIDGDASLRKRHTKPLIDALNKLGADITATPPDGIHGYAPITIKGSGGLQGGSTKLDGTESSQYLSSLLLVSPLAKEDVHIELTGKIVSKPYIEMTMEIVKQFGIEIDNPDERHYDIKGQQSYKNPPIYEVPADYSQAAFPLAAGCLVESDIKVRGLKRDDKQGDKEIITILQRMGANIKEYSDHVRVQGPTELTGIEVDLIDTPDLFPVLAVLGVYAKGKMRLYNMPQIRSKETDRIAVIERELTKYGVRVESGVDEMTVYHTELPERNYDFSAKGTHGVTDHRVSMALSLIGIRSGCAIIREADRVSISYPDYFTHLEMLGARTEEQPTANNEISQRLAV